MYGSEWGSIAAGHTTYTLFTTSHVRTHTRYYTIKSHTHCIWTCNEVIGSYVWWNHYHQVPSYTGKNITSLLPLVLLLVLHTCNNTDGNKLRIFFGIALYRGDTYNIKNSCMHCILCVLRTLLHWCSMYAIRLVTLSAIITSCRSLSTCIPRPVNTFFVELYVFSLEKS